MCSVRSCSTTLLSGLRVSPGRNSPVLRNWRKLKKNGLNLRMELFTPVLAADFKVEHHADTRYVFRIVVFAEAYLIVQ